MQLDAATIGAIADSLNREDLVIVPIRHHSPASLACMVALWDARPPSQVLIEGPQDCSHWIPWLVHPGVRLPVALYCWAHAQSPYSRYASYYPLSGTSPEWYAMSRAHHNGLPCRFVDLPYGARGEAQQRPPASLQDESRWASSTQLQRLAKQAGMRDTEELWEHWFEIPSALTPVESQLARLIAYCELVRADSSESDLDADGTLARERFMAEQICHALMQRKPGQGPVFAVMGGFHARAVLTRVRDMQDKAGPGHRHAPDARASQGHSGQSDDSGAAVIRYSSRRLDRLNGYAAGMTAPTWHQRCYLAVRGKPELSPTQLALLRAEVGLHCLLEAARRLQRQHALRMALPSIQAAQEQAVRLALLRRHPGPSREDLRDAVRSCWCQGEDDPDTGPIMLTLDDVLCGDEHGSVPPGAGAPPLLADVQWRLRKARLKLDDSATGGHQRRNLQLSIHASAAHRTTSQYLHGLLLLNVPFALLMQAAGGPHERIREQWHYRYTPDTEAALVEASVYGNTLPEAIRNAFAQWISDQRMAGRQDAAQVAGWLERACRLGLQEELEPLLAVLHDAIHEEIDPVVLAEAADTLDLLLRTHLALLGQRAGPAANVPQALVVALWHRAMYLLGLLQSHARADKVVDGLRQWRALATAYPTLDRERWLELIRILAERHPQARVRGAALALSLQDGLLDMPALAHAVKGHWQGAATLGNSEGAAKPHGDWVELLAGILQVAPHLAFERAVVQAVDSTIVSMDEAQFVHCLPTLRLAFSRLTPRETDRIAEQAAALHGVDAASIEHHSHWTLAAAERWLPAMLSARRMLLADGLVDWWRDV